MNYEAELVILPVTLAIQGLRLPDGSLLAVELAQPQQKHAVMIRPKDGEPQLHSLHDTEAEADMKAAEVLELWDGGWAPAGGQMQ